MERFVTHTRWGQRLIASACALGCAMGLALMGAGSASATSVDETKTYNNEPDWNPTISGRKASDVITLTMSSVAANAVVTVRGGHGQPNTLADNGIVELWTKGYEDASRSIVYDNQSWEFVPAPDNSIRQQFGYATLTRPGTIDTGWGWLRSRTSGKCLDVTGASTANNASVAQFACVNDAPNQQWRMVNGRLQVRHSGASLSVVGTTMGDNSCRVGGIDGARLVVGYPDTADAPGCDAVTAQRTAYRFATNKVVEIPDGLPNTFDYAQYSCINFGGALTPSFGYRYGGFDSSAGDFKPWDGLRGVTVNGNDSTATVRYYSDGAAGNLPFYANGQVYIICNPI